MDVARATDGVFERGDAGRFTGEVWLRGTITVSGGTNIGWSTSRLPRGPTGIAIPAGNSSIASLVVGACAREGIEDTCSSQAT